MAKITPLVTVSSGYLSTAQLNSNFSAIETAFDNTVSRDGSSPNTMLANLDMNSNRILNLPEPQTSSEPARKSDLLTIVGEQWKGTSTTEVTIGNGSKSFSTQSDKAFPVGQYLVIQETATPANFMYGQVTAYSGTDLTVNVVVSGGSGTISSWEIFVSGIRGATGSSTGIGVLGSSTDNAITTWDGSGGDTVQVSPILIDDSANMTGVESLSIASNLIHTGDTDTNISFSTDSITVTAGNVEFLSANEDTQDELVINDAGTDIDFRVEGTSQANALFVQGSDGKVGIGTNTPETALELAGQLTIAEGATPGTPSTGNVVFYAKTDGVLYYKDDTGSETSLSTGGGQLLDEQIFTTSGTWNKPMGTNSVRVWVVGGGGNGGSIAADPGVGNISVGAGGGGGGSSYKRITSAIGSSETVTVGGAGGTSSFGSHCSATGGSNGTVFSTGGAGGSGTGGDVNLTGKQGNGGGTNGSRLSGEGGDSSGPYGGNGGAGVSVFSGVSSHGLSGNNYGGGGSGAGIFGTGVTQSRTGGTGAGGIVVVQSYS